MSMGSCGTTRKHTATPIARSPVHGCALAFSMLLPRQRASYMPSIFFGGWQADFPRPVPSWENVINFFAQEQVSKPSGNLCNGPKLQTQPTPTQISRLPAQGSLCSLEDSLCPKQICCRCLMWRGRTTNGQLDSNEAHFLTTM